MPIPAAPRSSSRELLRDNVYTSLRDAIVDGTLAPGERLRDSDIEAWLGVSRTPIREAVQRLERAGLVVSLPGRSTTVAPVDATSTGNAQQIAAAMHELAGRLAAPLVSDDAIAELERANADFAAAIAAGDTDAALRHDDRFHDVIVGACGNAMVAEVLELTTPLLRRVERLRFGSFAARDSVTQHETIIRAIRARDAEATARASRDNWLALGLSADSADAAGA
ncbi:MULTISPECIES: GntR family transcriptional regulator [Microbacterium]|uniref:GntR family transcriptional regulator n=1 Tax=Microbacterium TaxID=33882 RepID=UPI00278B9515|nr:MULTISPECIES: GntR family transcriptional regulator [Microbacterium]MDQ1083434.1 DNA-binding GntR family transcriptional regulator [Microbacterium sp. SORGH_AS_0344]MDQ1171286.1 DNA-binding GntR family transcriptional regulator [Microbacterium proteolyticum]